MKRKNAPRVHFSLLVLCYLEVVLWTACLLTSSTTLPSEALAGQGYLQRETGNLKNLINLGRATPTGSGAPPGPHPNSGGGDPSAAAAADAAAASSAFSFGGGGNSPPWLAAGSSHLGTSGWSVLLAGERHFQLERFYLRQVLASWASLLSGVLAGNKEAASSGGNPVRPTPGATGLPAPFAGVKAID